MDTTEIPSQESPESGETQRKIVELQDLKTKVLANGTRWGAESPHTRGKLTARERLDLLLDPGTFNEVGMFVISREEEVRLDGRIGDRFTAPPGAGVVTGYGQIDGRLIYVYSQDGATFDGLPSEAHVQKICTIMDLAMKNGAPIIGLIDSTGVPLQKHAIPLVPYADIFLRNVQASGVVPQISAIMGPCVSSTYSAALTDFIFMVEHTSYMVATDPDMLKIAANEDVTREKLGEAWVHNTISGVTHFACPTELNCLRMIRELVSYIPSNNTEDAPLITPIDPPYRVEEALDTIIPTHPDKPYDMKEVIRYLVDEGNFFEVQEHFATNILVGFARLNGRSVGIVAQQPKVLAGALDINAADKGARFIRFCDCFNIPIITLVDVPGFLPGKNQEHNGIIRHGAKLPYAYCEATVPKITVNVRKTYGGGYVMGNKHFRGDINYAWPTAAIAVMGAEGAVNILFKDEINSSKHPAKRREELVAEYNTRLIHPYIAASRGYIDEVIEPCYTRIKLLRALELLKDKRDSNLPKKHGNIPL